MKEKNTECCEECYDVAYEKTYPAHTAVEGCTKGFKDCPCHTTPTDSGWRERFEDAFGQYFKYYGVPKVVGPELKRWIEKEITAAREEVLGRTVDQAIALFESDELYLSSEYIAALEGLKTPPRQL